MVALLGTKTFKTRQNTEKIRNHRIERVAIHAANGAQHLIETDKHPRVRLTACLKGQAEPFAENEILSAQQD